MDSLFAMLGGRVARILFAIPFAAFGLMHLAMGSKMAGMVPAWVPGGVLWVYVTGAALVAAAVSFIIGKMMREAALGLALLMLVFILTIHLPGLGGKGMAQQMAMTGFLKDFGLMAGALLLGGSAPPER